MSNNNNAFLPNYLADILEGHKNAQYSVMVVIADRNGKLIFRSDLDRYSLFPMRVFNVDKVEIGIAQDQPDLCRIWNGDPDNLIKGIITPMGYPATMRFTSHQGAGIACVHGEPVGRYG